jgi:hypothetical protein
LEQINDTDIPQADSLHTIGNLVALISSGIEDKDQLESHLGIVQREVDYYLTAARILCFLDDCKKISELGRRYCDETSISAKKEILRAAIRHTRVGCALLAEFHEKELEHGDVTKFLLKKTNLSESTASRRAKTLMKWFSESR